MLIGPTAVGKTKLSLNIAKEFRCEIISGDSMQVYRQMNIGTDKLPLEKREGIVHHLIDICNPDESFSVAEFQTQCRSLIKQISSRQRLPFLVGGTGLYIESVCYGFTFRTCKVDPAYRKAMEQLSSTAGCNVLWQRLQTIDPITANRLHPNDQRRIIRALEIYELTGQTMSSQLAPQSKNSPYQLCMIGLTTDRAILYQRIEARIEAMLENHFVAEVHSLLKQGYSRKLGALQALGYKEIAAYIQGEMSLELAVEHFKRNTRRFAKRQLSWFRHMKDIHWVDVTDSNRIEQHFAQIYNIIAGKFQ